MDNISSNELRQTLLGLHLAVSQYQKAFVYNEHHGYIEHDGFDDAIRNAISLGGDSDTLAAITGSIAEAFYSVPDIFVTNAYHYLDDTLLAVIHDWLNALSSQCCSNLP